MMIGLFWVRSLSPFRSSGVLTGRLLLVRWRKPCSDQAKPINPWAGNLARMSWPIG